MQIPILQSMGTLPPSCPFTNSMNVNCVLCSLLVRPLPGGARGKPQLVLLDHGLYRALPSDLRLNYAHFWQVPSLVCRTIAAGL